AFRSRAADHHGRVLIALLFGQNRVPVVRDAGNDPRLAGAADAFLAGMRHLDAGLAHALQNGLALWDHEFALGARKLDDEAALLRCREFRCEIFDMDLILRPIGGRGFESCKHRRWPAAIKMRVPRQLLNDRGDLKESSAFFVVEMEVALRMDGELI